MERLELPLPVVVALVGAVHTQSLRMWLRPLFSMEIHLQLIFPLVEQERRLKRH